MITPRYPPRVVFDRPRPPLEAAAALHRELERELGYLEGRVRLALIAAAVSGWARR